MKGKRKLQLSLLNHSLPPEEEDFSWKRLFSTEKRRVMKALEDTSALCLGEFYFERRKEKEASSSNAVYTYSQVIDTLFSLVSSQESKDFFLYCLKKRTTKEIRLLLMIWGRVLLTSFDTCEDTKEGFMYFMKTVSLPNMRKYVDIFDFLTLDVQEKYYHRGLASLLEKV